MLKNTLLVLAGVRTHRYQGTLRGGAHTPCEKM